MDRGKWGALGLLAIGGVSLAIYLRPYLMTTPSVAPMAATTILEKTHQALQSAHVTEELNVTNRLVPPGFTSMENTSLISGSIDQVTWFSQGQNRWRLEESTSGQPVNVIARDNNRLVSYNASTNRRVWAPIARGGSSWSIWPLPSTSDWEAYWDARVGTGKVGPWGAYQVTLTPKEQGTLVGHVTYWIDAQHFIPLGIEITDRSGQSVLFVKAKKVQWSANPTNVLPPSAGQLVRWSSTLMGQNGGTDVQLPLPSHLGPLSLTAERRMGSNQIATYGTGAGRILVWVTTANAFSYQKSQTVFRAVPGDPGYRALSDGILSVVTLHVGHREVTLVASRPQSQLARWAKTVWH